MCGNDVAVMTFDQLRSLLCVEEAVSITMLIMQLHLTVPGQHRENYNLPILKMTASVEGQIPSMTWSLVTVVTGGSMVCVLE